MTSSVKELKSVTEKPIEFIDEKQMSALEFANEMINTLSEEIKARWKCIPILGTHHSVG